VSGKPSGNLDEPDQISATTLDVNVWGPINGMRAALPGMIDRGRGHVVNVASLAGKQHLPGLAVYCASKFAVVGLTAAVRDEVAASGVSVSAVLPSMVKTELASGISAPDLMAVEPEDVARAIVASVRSRDAEIVVPAWMGPANAAMAITPSPVVSLFRRVARFDRGLDAIEQPSRAEYISRVSQQAESNR
jgi:short-subunit dehydrogenase